MKTPMMEKYVDERIGLWFIFGTHKDESVDISDGRDDVFEGIPRKEAEEAIKAHNEFREKLYTILCKEVKNEKR